MWGQAGMRTVAAAFGTGEAGAAYGQTQQHAGWAQGRGRRRRPDVWMLATPLLQDHRHS